MNIKVSDHFYLEEFLPKEIFEKYQSLPYSIFLDNRIIKGIEKIRRYFDKSITINNWAYARPGETIFNESCYRSINCVTGAQFSQHKFGRAIDFRVYEMDSLEVQKEIQDNWSEFNIFFTAMEHNTIGWTHLDGRYIVNNDNKQPILIPIS